MHTFAHNERFYVLSVCGRSQVIIPSGELLIRYKNEKHKHLTKSRDAAAKNNLYKRSRDK